MTEKVKVTFGQEENVQGRIIPAGTPVEMEKQDLKFFGGHSYFVEKITEKNTPEKASGGKK